MGLWTGRGRLFLVPRLRGTQLGARPRQCVSYLEDKSFSHPRHALQDVANDTPPHLLRAMQARLALHSG